MERLTPINLSVLGAEARASLVRRSARPDPAVRLAVETMLDDIACRGDAAVAEYAARHGGGFERIGRSELIDARLRSDPHVVDAIERSADAIRVYHETQLPRDTAVSTADGVEITRRWNALGRVAAYVPGGKAAYPSTVLMTVIPATIAGVEEIVVVSPARPDGQIDANTLTACSVAGATEVWAMGGAHAVGAFAFGTETIDPVQKIVGPGNQWVTAAKLAVFGTCAIDLPAGPSEVLVLADDTANPTLVAVDLLCQAEHGPDSPAVLVSADPSMGSRVDAELERLLGQLGRRDILEDALANHGLDVLAGSHDEAVSFAEEFAAEHVSIMTSDPERDAKRITAAGSVYIGRFSPESAGDYATGANHVLPTGGLAGAFGPLGVEDFGSWRQEQRITRDGLGQILDVITTLAEAEGLTAHRLAAELRLQIGDEE